MKLASYILILKNLRHISTFFRRFAIFFRRTSTFFRTAGNVQKFSVNTTFFRSGSTFFRSFSERAQRTGLILVKSGFGARTLFLRGTCAELSRRCCASEVPSLAAGRQPLQNSIFSFSEEVQNFSEDSFSELPYSFKIFPEKVQNFGLTEIFHTCRLWPTPSLLRPRPALG